MTTLIYIARIPSAKAHGPCSCCLIFSRFLPLCRCWRGQECKTEAIIAPRNGDVKVWDPSASRAHPPRQRYEPLAKARTTPDPDHAAGGAKGPTNVQLPGCCHTRRDYNQQTKPPTEAVASPWDGGSLCAN